MMQRRIQPQSGKSKSPTKLRAIMPKKQEDPKNSPGQGVLKYDSYSLRDLKQEEQDDLNQID